MQEKHSKLPKPRWVPASLAQCPIKPPQIHNWPRIWIPVRSHRSSEQTLLYLQIHLYPLLQTKHLLRREPSQMGRSSWRSLEKLPWVWSFGPCQPSSLKPLCWWVRQLWAPIERDQRENSTTFDRGKSWSLVLEFDSALINGFVYQEYEAERNTWKIESLKATESRLNWF